ncbi:MAG: NAD-dependent epimerase/dehydratase family protein, partial [Treponema sp.]|nr:NAD-dependent epimerase/dehydratase family protein [Treponema sp.]
MKIGKFFCKNICGKGENVRDWLYVEDHARAIDLIFHEGRVA